ncbi:MAG TPA: cupredoxin domain-containing protein [Gemmatimonadaceae bacterium]|nr:cupredoxin domain-containing protein [Gemmatimonadaceae bacterium]
MLRHIRSIASASVLLAGAAACRQAPAARTRAYAPRTRLITVTTVPLLVKEQQALFPFLKSAFAKGGVLDGKEVYAFSPSTITVVEGDTVQLTLINPEDDEHSFVLPDLAVAMHPGTITRATYVARTAGLYPIVCAVQSHLPMMSGQLVVLSAASAAPAAPAPAAPARPGSAVTPGRS